MVKEILSIPEERLEEVIMIIRAGLKHTIVSYDTYRNLVKWCDEEEEYLRELSGEA